MTARNITAKIETANSIQRSLWAGAPVWIVFCGSATSVGMAIYWMPDFAQHLSSGSLFHEQFAKTDSASGHLNLLSGFA
jgi:hypothetical protein